MSDVELLEKHRTGCEQAFNATALILPGLPLVPYTKRYGCGNAVLRYRPYQVGEMKERRIMRLKHLIGLVVGTVAFYASSAFAQTDVLPGYDLFESLPATEFMGQPFQGVPIGNYNFGGIIGVKNTDLTDTIVQRLSTASVASTPNTAAPISLQLLDLQLESTTPTTLGGLGPLGFYFITTQSQDGDGPASTGSMSITFASPAGGTFASSLDVFFDIHFGAPERAGRFPTEPDAEQSGRFVEPYSSPGSGFD